MSGGPVPTTVPDALDDVDFIEKDSKRFPDIGGWGYEFDYDAASDAFAPDGSGTDCGRVPYDSSGKRLHCHGTERGERGTGFHRPYVAAATGEIGLVLCG